MSSAQEVAEEADIKTVTFAQLRQPGIDLSSEIEKVRARARTMPLPPSKQPRSHVLTRDSLASHKACMLPSSQQCRP